MPTPSRRILVEQGLQAAKAPVKAVGEVVHETAALLSRDGRIDTGDGKIATVIALLLGFLSLLGVLAFHFPEYLTTPQLRHKYSVEVLRHVLLVTLLIAGGLSLANLI